MTTLAQSRSGVNPGGSAGPGGGFGPRQSRLIEQLRLKTAAEIWERDERFRGVQAGTVTTASTPPALARINEVIASGAPDRTPDGAFKTYEGPVGGEAMWAQCHALGDDLVISFWSKTDPAKRRRLLVTPGPGGIPRGFLHVTGQHAAPHEGDYAKASTRIIARRAWERENGLQVLTPPAPAPDLRAR